jgi:hypothetical protein
MRQDRQARRQKLYYFLKILKEPDSDNGRSKN